MMLKSLTDTVTNLQTTMTATTTTTTATTVPVPAVVPDQDTSGSTEVLFQSFVSSSSVDMDKDKDQHKDMTNEKDNAAGAAAAAILQQSSATKPTKPTTTTKPTKQPQPPQTAAAIASDVRKKNDDGYNDGYNDDYDMERINQAGMFRSSATQLDNPTEQQRQWKSYSYSYAMPPKQKAPLIANQQRGSPGLTLLMAPPSVAIVAIYGFEGDYDSGDDSDCRNEPHYWILWILIQQQQQQLHRDDPKTVGFARR